MTISKEGYHSFSAGGSFEVWKEEPGVLSRDSDGWYWWPCFPGCLPDGEKNGPFETSQEAHKDADPDHPDYKEIDRVVLELNKMVGWQKYR